MSTPVWEETPAVEFVEADCAVRHCDEVTFGDESPVMPGLTEDGQLVRITLQFCPKHAAGFELVMAGFSGNQGRGGRTSTLGQRYGHGVAVEGLIAS